MKRGCSQCKGPEVGRYLGVWGQRVRLGERIRRDGASSKPGGLIVMPTCGSSAGERRAVQCGVVVLLYDLGHMKAGAEAHSPQETPFIPVLSCCSLSTNGCLCCPPVVDGHQF